MGEARNLPDLRRDLRQVNGIISDLEQQLAQPLIGLSAGPNSCSRREDMAVLADCLSAYKQTRDLIQARINWASDVVAELPEM